MHCYFCQKNKTLIDFKDTSLLRRFLAASGKIKGRKKTGLCAKHQRAITLAVKRSRIIALLPFVQE
ncbi:30S ribosomal protein S18 [Candidatus Gribaldobacteria bacterium]|nr:30S ribosomal protein S18 [Candidatus Gribaldobacteria bacterium]